MSVVSRGQSSRTLPTVAQDLQQGSETPRETRRSRFGRSMKDAETNATHRNQRERIEDLIIIEMMVVWRMSDRSIWRAVCGDVFISNGVIKIPLLTKCRCDHMHNDPTMI